MERIDITDTNNHYFSNFLREFKNSPCLGYKSKQVYNERIETYLFLINYILKPIKTKKHARLRTKGEK